MKRLTPLAALILSAASYGQGWTGDVATLTPSAANISFQQGLGTLVVQANSVPTATPIYFGPSPLAPSVPRLVPGTIFSIGRPFLQLSRSATLGINYSTRSLPVGTSEANMRIYTLSNHKWILVGGVVNIANKTVVTNITRGGTYALFAFTEATGDAEELLVQAHSSGGSNALMHDWFRVSTGRLFFDGVTELNTVGRSIERTLPTTVSPAYNAIFDTRREPTGFEELYSRNADGSHPVRLTSINAESFGSVSVSGDGRKVAFSTLIGGTFRVHSMNADGSNLVLLGTGAVPLTGNVPVAINPAGTQVSYAFGPTIRVCLAATGTLLRTILLPPGNTSSRGLAYNSVGTTLAMTTNIGVYTVPSTAGVPTLIHGSPDYGRSICWSPDGTRLAVRYRDQIDVLRLSPFQIFDKAFSGDFGDDAVFSIAWR